VTQSDVTAAVREQYSIGMSMTKELLLLFIVFPRAICSRHAAGRSLQIFVHVQLERIFFI
jgi:hypothetical protein